MINLNVITNIIEFNCSKSKLTEVQEGQSVSTKKINETNTIGLRNTKIVVDELDFSSTSTIHLGEMRDLLALTK